jgi:hypothetical protein
VAIKAGVAVSSGGGAGGILAFNTELTLEQQCDREQCRTFKYGWLDPSRPFVHVLDDDALEIVLHYRDTITDFIRYLEAIERFLRELRDGDAELWCAGEKELLAYYL